MIKSPSFILERRWKIISLKRLSLVSSGQDSYTIFMLRKGHTSKKLTLLDGNLDVMEVIAGLQRLMSICLREPRKSAINLVIRSVVPVKDVAKMTANNPSAISATITNARHVGPGTECVTHAALGRPKSSYHVNALRVLRDLVIINLANFAMRHVQPVQSRKTKIHAKHAGRMHLSKVRLQAHVVVV